MSQAALPAIPPHPGDESPFPPADAGRQPVRARWRGRRRLQRLRRYGAMAARGSQGRSGGRSGARLGGTRKAPTCRNADAPRRKMVVHSKAEHRHRSPRLMSNERLARRILVEIDRNPSISQRQLSVNLGVSIGIVNWHMKRFVTKGLVKLQTAPGPALPLLPDSGRIRGEGEADGGVTSRPPSTSFARGASSTRHCSASAPQAIGKTSVFLGDSELVELACMAHSRTDGVQVRCILDPRSSRDRRGRSSRCMRRCAAHSGSSRTGGWMR